MSMVERHFPAPNKKKTFDLLSLFDDEPSSPKHGTKRKKTFGKLSACCHVQELRIVL